VIVREEWIPALAKLYEKFAHSLEPFSGERDNAERVFIAEVLIRWENLDKPKPSQLFRKLDEKDP
jgi:hypothetical protein